MKHKRLNILFALGVYYPKIHQGLVEFAKEAKWNLRFCRSNQVQEVLNWKGDGVILGTGLLAENVEDINNLACPVVYIGELEGVHSIYCDNKLIAEKAYLHFKERSFVNYAIYNRFSHHIHPRQQVFKSFAEADDFSCASLQASQDEDWLARRAEITEQLQSLKKPVAVFTEQDETALELIDICLTGGFSVPEEIAVIGVRNDDLICAPSAVPVSSVENLQHEHGYKAGQFLSELIYNPQSVKDLKRVLDPGDVVARRSTDVFAINHSGVLKALKFIQKNYKGGITTADIVAASGLSHNGLIKAFKTHLNRTPSEELLRTRLDSAKDLLKNSDLSINEVAQEAGFGDYHSLYFSFKRSLNQTPKQYRQKTAT